MLQQLVKRNQQPEIMDQPGLAAHEHHLALRGLRRINAWSGSVATVWPAIQRVAQQRAPQTTRVLDVACGGGDLAIAIARRARKLGLPIEVDGCDKSSVALEYCQGLAVQAGVSSQFFPLDVLENPLPPSYHVIMCSLFLHHLTESECVQLLEKMRAAAEELVLANDLRRTRLGYMLARWGTRLLSRSRVVHVDGPLSVAGAFSLAEVSQLARQAQLEGAQLRAVWPERFLLSWSRR